MSRTVRSTDFFPLANHGASSSRTSRSNEVLNSSGLFSGIGMRSRSPSPSPSSQLVTNKKISRENSVEVIEIQNPPFEPALKKVDSLPNIVLLSLVVAMSSPLLMGYDEGIMSGAIEPLKTTLNFTDSQGDIVMGALNVTAGFGALLAGKMSDYIGRKRSITATSVLLVVGPVVMCSSFSYAQMLIGRILTGLGVGFSMCIPPLYAAELSPAHLRGTLVAIGEVLINFGIFLGYTSSYLLTGLPDYSSWRYMLGLAAVIPFFILFTSPFLPETPRWLALKGKNTEAQATIQRIYKEASSVEYQVKQLDVQQEQERKQKEDGQTDSWKAIFCPTPVVRRMLAAGLGIACFQQLSGSEAVVYYSPEILKQAGAGNNNDTILLYTMGVGFSKFIAAFYSAFTVESRGRRSSALWSSFGVTVSLAALSLAQYFGISLLSLVSLCLFMITFEIGLGPCLFIIGSEVYPIRLRAKGLSLGLFLNRLISGIISGVFPVLLRLMGAATTYFVFTIIATLGIVYIWKFIPETKGLTLEETQLMFERKNYMKMNESYFRISSASSFSAGYAQVPTTDDGIDTSDVFDDQFFAVNSLDDVNL